MFILLVLLLGSPASYAQGGREKDDERDFNLPNGIRFGYQWANFVKDGDQAAENLDRGYIGYARKWKIIPLIHLETGLEYMIAGAKIDEDNKLQLHYLVIPVQGLVKVGPFIGLAGLSGNIRIAEQLELKAGTVNAGDDKRSSGFDLAANLGAGFNILMLTFEARHYWGLLDVDDGWHNRYWQAGLKFHF
jgi:hypothetical protein